MPRSACARTVCYSHLRLTWKVLTVLTVLCVALQLLGVVRQARDTKVIRPADEQSAAAERQDGGILRSIPATLDPHQRDYQLFQWSNGKNLDTTPARRLTSTVNRILVPNGYQLAGKASQPKEPNKEPWVFPEIVNQSPAQSEKSENVPKMPPEVPLEDKPGVHPEVVKQPPIQRQNSENMSPKVPSRDAPGVILEVVKQSPAQNQNSESMLRTSPEVPPKDEPGLNLEVVKQSPAQMRNSKNMPPDVLSKELHKPQISSPNGIHADSDNQAIIVLSHDEVGVCRPKNHIVFLKTHKTASSTILNILYRYGDSQNLTFALPANMYSQLYYPYFFMSYFVEGSRFGRVKEFHIMCNHMRFRGLEVRKVMPVDTFYFSILRNPVSMMESIFTYYKSIPAFQNFKTLTEFLLDGGRSFNASLPSNHYARNLLTFDFGMDSSPPASKAELDQRSTALIAAVESNFHLILISEYFDESMILLKHALCWTLEDIVSFRLNSRSEKSRHKLSPELAELVKQWSSLDWRLYQHFNATFWRRIDTMLGRAKLQEEVELLRARRAELEQTCLLGGGAVDPSKVQDESLKPFQYGTAVIQGYNIRPGLDKETHRLCQRLIMPELQYTTALYTKQFPDLVAKFKNRAKMVATKNLAAARRTTTRLSALNHNLQTRAAAVHKINSQSNTNGQPQKLAKDSSVVKSDANVLAQRSIETQSDPSKYKAIKHNIPS
ncbi:hypothetical protein SRHO_G00210780 [Serrasalmus rhombeus]